MLIQSKPKAGREEARERKIEAKGVNPAKDFLLACFSAEKKQIKQKSLPKKQQAGFSEAEPACFLSGKKPGQSAFLGQALTHSIQRMHSVPFFRLLAGSVISTSMGQTRLHFPQEMHFAWSHFILRREK